LSELLPQNHPNFRPDGQFPAKKNISLATCPGKTPEPISMIYGLNDADCHKEVPFGSLNE